VTGALNLDMIELRARLQAPAAEASIIAILVAAIRERDRIIAEAGCDESKLDYPTMSLAKKEP